jgi:hypothetical protein
VFGLGFVVVDVARLAGPGAQLSGGQARDLSGQCLVGLRCGEARGDGGLVPARLAPAQHLAQRGKRLERRGRASELDRGAVFHAEAGHQPVGHVAGAVLAVGLALLIGRDHPAQLTARGRFEGVELSDRVDQFCRRAAVVDRNITHKSEGTEGV